MKKLLLILITVFTMNINTYAQSPQSDVQKVIETLFNGMRAGDSGMVSKAFSTDAIMQTVAKNEAGATVVKQTELAKFLDIVGTPRDEVLDERITSYDIKVDGELASAWTPYQFYIGEKFSHCGVNSFQLVKTSGQWNIVFIIDTRRKDDCVK